jgi:hypothetical protein
LSATTNTHSLHRPAAVAASPRFHAPGGQSPSGPGVGLGASASSAGAAIFIILAGLLWLAGSQTRRLSLASERLPSAPFVLIPDSPG